MASHGRASSLKTRPHDATSSQDGASFDVNPTDLSAEDEEKVEQLVAQFSYGSVTTSSAVTNGLDRDMAKRCCRALSPAHFRSEPRD